MASRRPTDTPRPAAAAPQPRAPTPTASTGGVSATPTPTTEKLAAAAKPPAVRKSRAKKPAALDAKAIVGISEDVRRGMIAEAAYLRAERRGFSNGDEREDWIAAEAEVDALLKAGRGRPPQ